MILAEYTLAHPILRETLTGEVPIELEWESSPTGPGGERRVIVWIESDDFEAVDAAIQDDPSVGHPIVLTDLGDRRLYRVDLTDLGDETTIIPVLAEVGGVHQSITVTSEGWQNRTQFPDREAFERIYQFCQANDIGFTFHRIWEHSERYGMGPSALTEGQREILLTAEANGYLDIPRACTLGDLAAALGISESAASERFRRATRRLIRQTLT